MPPTRLPFYLYIQNPGLNAFLTEMLLKAGYEPIQLDHTLRVDPRCELILIDTDDDVAHLSQVVSHLYHTYKVEPPLPVIAFLSKKALKHNPMLRYWLIDGKAAIMQIVPCKEGRLSKTHRRSLLWFLKRLLPLCAE
jgi:hypothetical protein